MCTRLFGAAPTPPKPNLEMPYPTQGVETPPDPRSSAVPYHHALDALRQSELAETDRWWTITASDFTKAMDGQRSMVFKLLYRLAQELAHVRVAHHLLTGSKMELRERDKEFWMKKLNSFEEQALEWGEEIYKATEQFYNNDQRQPLELEFALDTQTLSVGKLRSRLEKGEMLEDKEMQELTRGEWLSNFLGLMAEFMHLPDNQLLNGAYSGPIDRIPFYRTLGVRLFILWQRSNEPRYRTLSQKCFEKTLELTEAEPYHPDRQKANDFLARLKEQDNVKKKKKP